MLCSLATKAGAMAWRRGAQSGRGKGRGLRGASLSTTHTGTGTGSEGGSDTTIKIVTVTVAVLGLVSAVAGSTAVVVHHLDQTEIKRIHDKAATEIAQAKADVARDQTEIKRIHDKAAMEIAQAKADVARVEGERRLSEERLRAEVERYKLVTSPSCNCAGSFGWFRGGTGSEGGSDTTIKIVTVTVAVLGLVAAVAGSTAVAVHHLDQTEIKRIHEKAKADVARDQTEIKRIQDKAATEIKRIHDKATADVARVEGERRLSEERLRAEVERYKYDLRLTQTQDFEPYQAAIRENQTKRRGGGGPQD
ncbi:hypothetical protein NSK_005203 [Nannochloropsis salina CCMP1776]|uniref:Uncharacterized protein n=1 Tax=Nannochloropsis salina CCMP1776 TaxID=1027361 RepID=A0A4D9D4L2_9STRA|nr:hypothetical protein NSK_005203 [Nannochloropsis salina CCMP1776]|eukprot:TFJ83489.1 hypothetical protein NSK_005203 [Nannochloropsis salina CCMP1776]